MTELNIAYSYNGTDMFTEEKQSDDNLIEYQQPQQPQQPQQSQQSQMQPQMQPQIQPQIQPQMQPQIQPQIQAQTSMNNNYYMTQGQQQQQQQLIKKQQAYQQRNPEYSFWDRMALSRNDVFKLALLALVIVLGISIERIGNHYINQYLSDNILSSIQEFIIRVSYPIMIFIFLWIIKSL
jgi:hypothetical protein